MAKKAMTCHALLPMIHLTCRSSSVTYAISICGLGVVLYLTVIRGWRFGDFMYVTRRGLQQGLTQVHTSTLDGRVLPIGSCLCSCCRCGGTRATA